MTLPKESNTLSADSSIADNNILKTNSVKPELSIKQQLRFNPSFVAYNQMSPSKQYPFKQVFGD
eukprot:3252524-Ditylum_brightwellii.AAC.1